MLQRMHRRASWLLSLLVACAPHSAAKAPVASVPVVAPPVVPIAGDPALALLETIAEFSPESLTALGLPGHETEIVDSSPDASERFEQRMADFDDRLVASLASEKDPERRLDLELVRRSASLQRRQSALARRTFVAHDDVGKIVYSGLRALLTMERPRNEWFAGARLDAYSGTATRPSIFMLMQTKTRASMANPDLLYPTKAELLDELAHLDVYLAELDGLAKKRRLPLDLTELRIQAGAYATFLREQMLPRARGDFRLPPASYAHALERTGVGEAIGQVAARAREAYAKTLREMETLAPKVAATRKLRGSSAVAVLDALKQQQRQGDALVALYQSRLVELEKIIVREKLVTVPARSVRMRLATAGESAQNPAPSLDVTALFKKDASIDFIFPVRGPLKAGQDPKDSAYTDFTYDAASWVIAAHEARPGHELQFSLVKEKGLSLARTLFALNSVNIEGWGLYAEHLMFPYLPPDGQLVALRMRALREARAFLDPGLHDGSIDLERARAILRDELGFSAGVVAEELDRYTYEAPTQAVSYFVGYESLLQLRAEVEHEMGSSFDAKVLHDAILGAGMLPPDLLRERVLATLRAR